MQAAVNIFVNLLKSAWVLIVSFIVIAAALGMAYRVLQLAGASVMGVKYIVAEVVAALLTIIALAFLAFFAVPELVAKASIEVPRDAGIKCAVTTVDNSPLIQMADIMSQLIIAIGGVRMLLAFAKAISSAAIGGSGQMAQALLETGGIVLAALLASAIVPIVGVFLGSCSLSPLPPMPLGGLSTITPAILLTPIP